MSNVDSPGHNYTNRSSLFRQMAGAVHFLSETFDRPVATHNLRRPLLRKGIFSCHAKYLQIPWHGRHRQINSPNGSPERSLFAGERRAAYEEEAIPACRYHRRKHCRTIGGPCATSAVEESRAAVIGHDWGAAAAWTSALLRPDIFGAVGLLSAPSTTT